MMKYLIITSIILTFCFGANLIRAPKVEPKPIIGNYDPSLKPLLPPKTGYDQNIIYSIPDFRSTAGSAGKNIVFAEDGQNVAVIYNRFSGDPTNLMDVYISYSTDRGQTWINYGPLSTWDSRRTNPGLDADQNWTDPTDLRIHFIWHQWALYPLPDDSSPCFYAREESYPDGLITYAISLPNSSSWDVWYPCIAVKDSFVITTAVNNGMAQFTYDCYIWRSTDYGWTWDNGRLFFPGPSKWMAGPHFRFGSDGYMFFLWNRYIQGVDSLYEPYYCESFDYGVTWTQPQLIWQDNPPYPNMSEVTGWWYDYDCEVVNDTPIATLKLSTQGNDYGEIWIYRPDGGSPGNWLFRGIKLVGEDSVSPQPFAIYPTVGADDRGDIFVGYQAIFETPTDTGPDCGMFVRPYNRNVWLDYGQITDDFMTTEEKMLEFAHYVPMVADSAVVGFIYNNAGTYPTTGNLYFDWIAVDTIWIDTAHPYITESNHSVMNKVGVTVTPNPFRNSVQFKIRNLKLPIRLSIYDVTGKLVKAQKTNNQKLKTELIWNGEKSDGSLVKPGVYFYNLSSGSYLHKGKVILTR